MLQMALVNEPRQYLLHSAEILEPRSNIGQSLLGHLRYFAAVRLIFQLQQLGNLIQVEPQSLRRLNKPYPRHILFCVAANAAVQLLRFA